MKSKINKLDVDKLAPVFVDLKKIIDLVDKDVSKKTVNVVVSYCYSDHWY